MRPKVVIVTRAITIKYHCTECNISMRSFYRKATTMVGVKQIYLECKLSHCPICQKPTMEPMLVTCELV